MFRSAPTNKFDRDFTKGYIKENGVNTLEKLELARNKDRKQYDITITWLKGKGSGVIKTPIPDCDYLVDVGSEDQDREGGYYSYDEIERMIYGRGGRKRKKDTLPGR